MSDVTVLVSGASMLYDSHLGAMPVQPVSQRGPSVGATVHGLRAP